MAHGRIHIDPAWRFRDDAGNVIDAQLFQLLQAIYQYRKLTAAAKSTGISYRHSWNLLNKWSNFFGADLVKLEKGKGASLTPIGEKLLWAEQRIKARFQPQMESLASELNLEINKSLADQKPFLRIQASHGYAVALLSDELDEIQLDIQYSSPIEAIKALNRDTCDLAGLHVPIATSTPQVQEKYNNLIKPRAHKLIRFITRQQGLILRRDTVQSVGGLEDLTNPGVRFINRQTESGTRALFDQLLKNHGIDNQRIKGYGNWEFTHSAVAALIAAKMADVGFGVSHAAHLFGLEFIPICREEYFFICHGKSIHNSAIKKFIDCIQKPTFSKQVNTLHGYSADGIGQIEDAKIWKAY